eukprot:CAMPEP_0172176026 /NCGR_PEP_ID=MMETSP1050-20130122/14567_1 /TAXON_ID=233186 /ORGANISM="Cryptomonas curvata, Strain CCAP979/52" /LENGTH=74 /DNA_ID=CAMNT_0012848219 /DNA_START=493 /DNA_END=717 /DNA_ORIENTATION=-
MPSKTRGASGTIGLEMSAGGGGLTLAAQCFVLIDYSNCHPFSGVPTIAIRPPSSEATAMNPPCGEAKTAHATKN